MRPAGVRARPQDEIGDVPHEWLFPRFGRNARTVADRLAAEDGAAPVIDWLVYSARTGRA